ncbi:serine/threonine-protein kinase Nek9-like isoform X2 [Branchiostoma lanceolatum]|uniref:serine/threonine-protein kinase Nek9-like isoform X2 n=1 Tax=Branchiostoma lanceolatum TaxID=7740 RepID=UPI003456E51F
MAMSRPDGVAFEVDSDFQSTEGDLGGQLAETGSSDGGQEEMYIPVKVLGRGAFGEAILYRKTEDNSLLVWKEVDLTRLSEKERQESQTEIEILSMLDQPNIVSYYNHFLDGTTLLIEMEYANGGNLYEKIVHQADLFPEELIIWYFFQLVSAVAHIHEYGILHRDIKTLNIFLTKSGLVKLGDFGISKILENTSKMAESYVGTPYYMSPELIKGERYSFKSDIWSVGCVLYELLTLKRTFDASNPLRLAARIVEGIKMGEIDTSYSETIRSLAHQLLSDDTDKRPEAKDILLYPIFISLGKDMERKVWELNATTRKTRMSVTTDTVPVVTSKTSEVYYWGGGKQNPQKLDIFHGGSSALQVCAGRSHYAVVTVEKELFTWANVQGGVAMVGQLGHGDTASYRAPRRVECLTGTAISQVGCGEEFTACLTEEGKVYACGSDYWGCLGGENEQGDEVMIPIEVEFFSGRPVAQISCGDAHIVVLTREQEVYSWGCGEFGRLGLGSEDDFASPQKVEFCGSKTIKTIHCGPDGTFFLTANGRVLACGTNEHNKLGFNLSASGLVKRKKKLSYDIPCKLQPTLVRSLSRYQIVQIAAGQTHSAAIDVHGLLITFGSNKFGQLGVGDFKPRRSINVLRGSLMGRQVRRVSCGDGFTVAATSDNMIYSWGNGEDGRLGVTSDRGEKGPKGLHPSSVSRPRPIFGSLHLASDVSCRHWNTIMVVEKVLQQKTIRSQISTGKEEVDDSVFGSVRCTSEDGAMSDRDSGVPESFIAPDASNGQVNTVGDSVPPTWLQRELADSDIIPMAGTSAACPDDSVRPPDDSGVDFADCVPEWLKKELEDENYIAMATTNDAATVPVREEENDVEAFAVDEESTEVAQRVPPDGDEDTSQGHHPSLNISVEAQLRETIAALQEQLQQVQTDNQQLRDIVSEQNEKIRSLESKSKAHTEVDSQIWALIDQWQEECSEVAGGSRDGRRPRPATVPSARRPVTAPAPAQAHTAPGNITSPRIV